MLKKPFPFFTVLLSALCTALTLLVVCNPALFSLLAMWSSPEHPWQYLSGIFLHGIDPPWFALVHLGLNLLGLLGLGIVNERHYGTRACVLLFVAEWLVTALLFQCLHRGEHTYAVGISSIVYAQALPALPLLCAKLKQAHTALLRQPLFYYAVFEYLGLLSMLHPARGLSALLLHASGLLTGGVFLLLATLWRNRHRASR